MLSAGWQTGRSEQVFLLTEWKKPADRPGFPRAVPDLIGTFTLICSCLAVSDHASAPEILCYPVTYALMRRRVTSTTPAQITRMLPIT